MIETRLLSTPTTGRYLVEPSTRPEAPLLVGFHGYGQRAEHLLEDLRLLPGAANWTLVAVQALHRFYSSKTREVVGSWMTNLDRDAAIEDNVAYVLRVVAELQAERGSGKVVFAGFSQGAAMAWRAATRCKPCHGLVVLGGEVPKDVAQTHPLDLPPVLLGRGDRDAFYTGPQMESDLTVLESLGVQAETVCFEGGHEWGSGFLLAMGRFLEKIGAMHEDQAAEPDSTAVRVALWRALHLEVDPPPHVFEDEVGVKLAAPDEDWRNRPDMSPFTRPFRAAILARARFIEDLVAEQAGRGIEQYVILGAGLDTFAQRRSDLASRMRVFEIDRPGPQAWKRRRLGELGLGIPPFLCFVPVDFEAGDAWWDQLAASGFDSGRPAVVASTGVSMYLTKDAILATLRQVAALAPGSTLAMSFLLPIELADPEVRPGIERAIAGAQASGTPFLSFFTPEEMLALATEAGFRKVRHVSAAALAQRYFADRTDGLRPPGNSEELLVATT